MVQEKMTFGPPDEDRAVFILEILIQIQQPNTWEKIRTINRKLLLIAAVEQVRLMVQVAC